MQFIDEVRIRAIAGDGGRGCVAFRREKFVPKGGPSGGDGGRGGSVVFVGSENANTLYPLRHRAQLKAERGRHGEGSDRAGRSGEDVEVTVPLGTVVFDEDDDRFIGEILEHGQRLVVAQGGRGGLGNANFATATRQAPRYAQPGEEGEQLWLRCELKLLADVGVVGLPNAGKSTFISVVTAAKPKIADYPFTTLAPQLGVVARGVVDRPFVIADLPGLIEGASEGAGLGHRFLRHVERCRVLVHLVDVSGREMAEDEPGADEELAIIEGELRSFDPALVERPRIVVATKMDAVDEDRLAALESAAAARDLRLFKISSVTHEGLDPVVAALGELLEQTEPFPPLGRSAAAERETEAVDGIDEERPPRRLDLDSWDGPS